MAGEAGFHAGVTKKTITVGVPAARIWGIISQIARLPWVDGVAGAECLPGARTGRGAVRIIRFEDGKQVREHIVGWKRGAYLSYIATKGLPLRAYHATIRLGARAGGTQVTWQSYYESEQMAQGEFEEFEAFIGSFYARSLRRLKQMAESRAPRTARRRAGGSTKT